MKNPLMVIHQPKLKGESNESAGLEFQSPR